MSGCSFGFTGADGVGHIVGIGFLDRARERPQQTLEGEVLRFRSFGLYAHFLPDIGTAGVGYVEVRMGGMRDASGRGDHSAPATATGSGRAGPFVSSTFRPADAASGGRVLMIERVGVAHAEIAGESTLMAGYDRTSMALIAPDVLIRGNPVAALNDNGRFNREIQGRAE
jgi:hypothetical protein